MDGVIVNTEPLHKKAYFLMFSEVGIKVTEDLYYSFTGQSTLEICESLTLKFNLPHNPNTLVEIKRKHFKYLFDHDKTLDLLPGVLNLIKNYYTNGLKLVLASSASMNNINSIFKRFQLDKYFVGKISGATLPQSKPHPDIFIKAAEIAGHLPEQCMVIEDATNGIIAAKKAGIFCVAYKSEHSKNQEYNQADLVVYNFDEIHYSKVSKYFNT